MKISNATQRGLQSTRMFVKNNVDRFLQASQAEKDAILSSMAAINRNVLQFEISGNLILHPFLRDCNLDPELLVEALTQMPIGKSFEAGTVELATVAEALRKGRIKLDRLNAEIKQKEAEARILRKTILELRPQAIEKTVELDINTIMAEDEDVPELVAKYSIATPDLLKATIEHSSDRARGILTFIGINLMEIELPLENSQAFLNGYAAAEEHCEA